LAGIDARKRTPFSAIHNGERIYESLDDRVMAGFGGVASGITVRWDKNFKLPGCRSSGAANSRLPVVYPGTHR
jgi:hypothetical protein